MRTLWKALYWVAFTGLPTSLAYFTNAGGFASNLDKAVSNIAPVLGALLPFAAITFGVASAILLGKFLWVHGHPMYLNWRYADKRRFRSLERTIETCRENLVEIHDTPSDIFDEGEFARQQQQLTTDLIYLFEELFALGIPIPKLLNDGSQRHQKVKLMRQQQIKLIRYLTALEGYAQRGNLAAARNLEIAELQVVL